MKKNYPVTGRERDYSDSAIILSTTDLKGAITYVNKDFIEISGFELDELIHKNHNVVRHPEMPPAAFEDLWKTVKAGNSWMGIVKNRCKNGDHYWVDAFVTPVLDDGQVVEYQSIRTKPTPERVKRAEQVYRCLAAGKMPLPLRLPAVGILPRLIAGMVVALGSGISAAMLAGAPVGPVLLGTAITGVLGIGVIAIGIAPLRNALRAARRIIHNPLAQYIYTGRMDETGAILLALRTLEAEAGGIVGRLTDSAAQLSRTAEELTAAVEQSAAGVREQQRETDQVATAINEMSASVQEVAQNAQFTADAASNADREAKAGRNVVESTTGSIRSLAGEVQKAAEVIHRLEEESQTIGRVLEVINGIAEQTNLLALNAAIEAARAGDQGRGFAVVADEVRTLAQRTQASTEEIRQMIERLQGSANQAVTTMGGSREQAEASVEQANAALRSLDAITEAVGRITDMSTQIATAVEEQSTVGEEINRSIASIRHTSDASLENARTTEDSSVTMSGLARNLEQLACQFWTRRR